ncbi:MAG: SHD1 domain-containing protein, partial [Verrucomicrobiota bacterium]
GGFDTLPDLSDVTIFGVEQSIGNDFVGTYYDSKLDRNGRTLSVDVEGTEWRRMLNRFFRRDWDTSIFARYYRSPRKLYATSFVVPVIPSSMAPDAFGANESVGALWMAHYKGQLVHKEAITFRFWGVADEFLAVRVDGEVVLALDWWRWDVIAGQIIGNIWDSYSPDSHKYFMGNARSVVGDWITLEPGVPLPMEILMGDNGGVASFFLAVEVEGVEYERNRQGGPILPAFKTAELSHDQLDIIYNGLPVEEICLTNGPVFRDYDVSGVAAGTAPDTTSHLPPPPSRTCPAESGIPQPALRTWNLVDGRTIEAEFVNTFGGKVVLKNAKGKTYKIPPGKLSAGDLEYAELARPPVFNINFLKNFDQKRFSGGFYDVSIYGRPHWARPPESRGFFGVQFKQTSAGEYNHELQVEIFAIGKQRSRPGARYILLDHQKTAFTPSKEDQRFYEFRSKREVVLTNYVNVYDTAFGEKYAGYLVTVTDERGEVIAVESSNKWLYENLENLKKLSVGNYMDKTCIRAFPARPKAAQY